MKHLINSMRPCVIGIIVLSGLFFTACPPTNVFTVRELSFYTLFKGQNGPTEEVYFTIKSEDQYQQVYGQPSSGFDFANDMIIAVYKGKLFNGGYGYDIVQILEEESRIIVSIQFTPCSPCTRNLSSPYHIVGIEQNDKPVEFEEMSGDGSGFNERKLTFRPYQDLNIQVEETSYFVIKTEDEFINLTGDSSGGFDFNSEMLIAAYLGPLPNGGHGWEITNIVEVLNEIIVEVQYTSCGSRCTRVSSYEVDVVATENVDKDVYFVRLNDE